ncbi:S8 family serine peptidase [Marinigracilibium pacificum]|uniref:S8 family serine peptidase n=1 Tax=Marinigracilibium pacificum TaxID=2729599 RepID=A0A848IZH9_9BACT|nr:S8 family serine peptidase [Marinigracilibium pacificum]NMM48781.1 S8 family serine peptidase [Marinigracilibium pacificum]
MKNSTTIADRVNLLYLLVFFIFFNQLGIAQNHCEKGVVNIKVSEEMAVELSQSLQNHRAVVTRFGVPEIDAVSEGFKCSSIKRLFPYNPRFEEKHRKYDLHRWFTIRIDKSIPIEQAIHDYGELEYVEIAEPVMLPVSYDVEESSFDASKTGSLPTGNNDPFFGFQYSFENVNNPIGGDVSALLAWKQSTGNPDVIVAVIDGGIEQTHPDLAPNLWINEDEIPNNGIDDDNNGYIDDYNGFGFGERTGEYTPNNHGTHVGGTVAAATNNGIGVAGIAGGSGTLPGVKLMSCAAFSPNGTGGFQESFVYAADNGAVITQNSWRFLTPNIYIKSYEDAINYFINEAGNDEFGNQVGPMAGGLVVFAAGNENSGEQFFPSYLPQVIAVAATNNADVRAGFSNYGDWIDISAPGVSILSTVTGNNYSYFSGTSMACPHVSGAAALIVSSFGKQGFTPEKVKALLYGSADNIDQVNPEFENQLGWGRLNLASSLKAKVYNDPAINLSSDILDIGNIPLGYNEELIINVRNIGLQPLRILSVETISDALKSTTFPRSPIAVFDKDFVRISFTPNKVGPFNELVVIKSNDPLIPSKQVTITGNILSSAVLELKESYPAVEIDNKTIDEFTFEFANVGNVKLEYKLSLVGPQGEGFPINTIVNTTGQTPVNTSDQVRMKIDARGVPRGTYSYGVRFETNQLGGNVDTLFFDVKVLGPELTITPTASFIKVADNQPGMLEFELKNIGETNVRYSVNMLPGMSFNETDTASKFVTATGFEVDNSSEYLEEWASSINGNWTINENSPSTGRKALYGKIDSGFGLGIRTSFTPPIGESYVLEMDLKISEGASWMVSLPATNIGELRRIIFNTSENKLELNIFYGDLIELDYEYPIGEYFKLAIENNEFGNEHRIYINGDLVYTLTNDDFLEGLDLPKNIFGVFIAALNECQGGCEVYVDNYQVYKGAYRSLDKSYFEGELASGMLSTGSSKLVSIPFERLNSGYGYYYNDIKIDYSSMELIHSLVTQVEGNPSFNVSFDQTDFDIYYNSDSTIYFDIENTGGKDLIISTSVIDNEEYPFTPKQSVIYEETFDSPYLLDGWEQVDNDGYEGYNSKWVLNPGTYHSNDDPSSCLVDNYIGLYDTQFGGKADLISPGIKIQNENTYLTFSASFFNLIGKASFEVNISVDDKASWTQVLYWDNWDVPHYCEEVKILLDDHVDPGDIVYVKFSADIGYASSVAMDNFKIVEENSVIILNSSSKYLPVGAKTKIPLKFNSRDIDDGLYSSSVSFFDFQSGETFSQDLNIRVLTPGELSVNINEFNLEIEQEEVVTKEVEFTNTGESPLILNFDYKLPNQDNLVDIQNLFSVNFDEYPVGDLKQSTRINASSSAQVGDVSPYSGEKHLILNSSSEEDYFNTKLSKINLDKQDSVTSISFFYNFDNAQSVSLTLFPYNIPNTIMYPLVEMEKASVSFRQLPSSTTVGSLDYPGYKHFVYSYNRLTRENKIYIDGRLIINKLNYSNPVEAFAINEKRPQSNSGYLLFDSIRVDNGKAAMPTVRVEKRSIYLNPGESKTLPVIIDASRLKTGTLLESLSGNYNSYNQESFILPVNLNVSEPECYLNSKTNQVMLGTLKASSFNTEWTQPDKANDGKFVSKWESDTNPDQYLEVDLGKVNMIKRVRILWGTNYASSFDVYARSGLTDDWTKVLNIQGHTSREFEESLSNEIEARYVRIKMNTPATIHGYAVHEFELFGGCATGVPVISELKIIPEYYSLKAGETMQYQVEAKDQFGKTYTPTNIIWSAIGSAEIDESTGLLTGISDGEYEVMVTVDGVSATAYGTVINNDCKVSLVGSLSLNKYSAASSDQGGSFVAQRANDGDISTSWRSKYADNQWWYVELGDVYNIHEVNVDWGVNYATSYELQYRDSEGVWQVFYKDLNANGGLDELNLDGSVSTDAIRLWAFTRSGSWGFNIDEIEVYGVCSPENISGVSSVTFNLTAYPNPLDGVLQIKVGESYNGEYNVWLYDSQFNTVYNGEVELSANPAELPMNVNTLAPGVYLLKLVDSEGYSTTVKLFKE